MSEAAAVEVNGNIINTGTAGGLMEFLDYLAKKGYGSSASISPLRSAAKQIFATVENTEDFASLDISTLDLDEYVDRFATLAAGRYKVESLDSYRARFRRAIEMYKAFLENGRVPQMPVRTPTTRRPKENPGTPVPAAPQPKGPATLPDELVNYPFPLKSGQLAYVQLPIRVDREDAERLATFVRSLVLAPQRELNPGPAETTEE